MSLKTRIDRLEHPGGGGPDEILIAMFRFGGKTVDFGGETIPVAQYESRLEARMAAAKAAGRNLRVICIQLVNERRMPPTNGRGNG